MNVDRNTPDKNTQNYLQSRPTFTTFILAILISILIGIIIGGFTFTIRQAHQARLVNEALNSISDTVTTLEEQVEVLRIRYEDLLGEALTIKTRALTHNPRLTSGQAGELAAETVKQATAHNLTPGFVAAVIAAESNWRLEAVSNKGAIGLMQLMPGTARSLGVDPHDWRENIAGGARYLKMLLDRFDGDMEVALAAYNAGPTKIARIAKAGISRGGLARDTWPRETKAYVDRVMRTAERQEQQ